MSIIIGTNASDVITGTNQGDIILAGNGNDTVDGGAGIDIIDGGNGNDTINGGLGTDILGGGNGDDTLDGGANSDLVSGGRGNDTLIYRATENVGAYDIYVGGAGQDPLRLVVTQAMADSAAFQADLAALQAMLAHGSTSFVFHSIDLAVASIESVQVIIEGGSTNHAPVAVADTVSAVEDTTITILASSLLANDTDTDSGDTKTLVSVQSAVHGSVSLNPSGNVVFVADANYSGVASFTYTMMDAAGATSTATVTVNVAAVADAPTLNVAAATGNEDAAIPLSVSSALTDTDGSEQLASLVVSAIPVGATLSDGTHSFTAAVGSTSVDISGWTLSSLTIAPPANSDADFVLTVTATSQEGANGSTATTAATLAVTVNATADAPTLTVSDATGNEDGAISLSVASALTDIDGSESLSITISGVPAGASLSAGTDNGDGSWTLTPAQLAGLTITPAADSDADFALTVTATATEANGGDTATNTGTIQVTVNAVADAPAVAASSFSVEASSSDVPLGISVALTDADGSEALGASVTIEGIPSSFQLNHGFEADSGSWIVPISDLSTLALQPVGGAIPTPGEFVLHVTATSIDGVSTASTTADLTVTITPNAQQQSGFVVDGYIAGATVFADADGDGVLDDGEAYTTTNADGSFTLTGGTGPLVMFGGTDVSTGLAFDGVLKAPEGSTVVTPLTTLVAELAATLGSVEAAQDAVAAAFGLDTNIDLQTFDPVPLAVAGDANATAVLSAAIQVQSTITQVAAVGVSGDSVITAIAAAISDANGATVDLSQSQTIETIATDSGVNANAIVAVTDVVTAANQSIQDAVDVTELAQAAVVAQGTATEALATTNFNDQTQIDALTQTFVTDLNTQVANAEVGAVGVPIIGTLGNDVLTGTASSEAIDGLDGNDAIKGEDGNDFLYGGAGKDTLTGGAGDDLIDGGSSVDLAIYTGATGPITVDLAAGTVSGAGVDSDTLRSIERIRGSGFDDIFVATGFDTTSTNASSPTPGLAGTFNEFEGMDGDDDITGNGNTRVSYLNAAAGVTVDVADGVGYGTLPGDLTGLAVDPNDLAGVGQDTFTGVSSVRGSNFADFLFGSNNPNNVFESFEGRGGSDFIDGRGGLDRVNYVFDASLVGITVDLAAGTVTGNDYVGPGNEGVIGQDTLRSIETVSGTNFDDTYDATGFSATSTNAGSNGTFNEFQGFGGADTIIGNGNTRVSYISANAGVTVDLLNGWAHGTDPSDIAGVGEDIFTGPDVGGFMHGIAAVRGSTFNDTLLGSNNPANTTEQFEGFAGDDLIDGRGGFDRARYDAEFNGEPFGPVGITVNMALGTVNGLDADSIAKVGSDTLRSIESVRGTNSADIYDATGGDGPGGNAGFGEVGALNVGNSGTLNEFEGMGGNDDITGNGNTRISYSSALAGVTIDLSGPTGTAFGTALGDIANVGIDTINGGVSRIRGSQFDDTITGTGGNDTIEGQGGSDTINGGNGTDIVVFTGSMSLYTFAGVGPGVFNVIGPDSTDTLTGVELLQFDDVYRVPGGLINISSLSLTPGKAIFGGTVDTFLSIGLQANGRLIDLDGGNDTLTLTQSGTYNLNIQNVDSLTGTSGADFVTLTNVANGITVNLAGALDTLNLANGANVLTVFNTDTVNGGTGFDTVTLGSAANIAVNSVESVIGSSGIDHVTLNAGPGVALINASFDLGGDNDTLTLNVFGTPTLNLTLANVETVDSTGGIEAVTLTNVANGLSIDLGTGFDTLTLAPGNNVVTAINVETLNAPGAGDDTVTFIADSLVSNQAIALGFGTDVLNLAGSDDTLVMSISGGSLTVNDQTNGDLNLTLLNQQAGTTFDFGGGANDTLQLFGPNDVTVVNIENVVGSAAFDSIHIGGNSGVTTVTGGVGADAIFASANEDHFRFGSIQDSAADGGVSRDVIDGFDASQDVLVFEVAAGVINGPIAYIGSSDFTAGGLAEAHLINFGGANLLQIDADGDGVIGANDMEIELPNLVGALTNGNFDWHVV